MNNPFKKIALFASVLVLLFFIIFVINQTAQVVELADKVNPKFGGIVFRTLLIVYAVLILIPVVSFLRLPRSLMPPRSEDAPEFGAYLEALKERLASNPHLKDMDPFEPATDREGIGNPGEKCYGDHPGDCCGCIHKYCHFAKWASGRTRKIWSGGSHDCITNDRYSEISFNSMPT